MGYKIIQNKKMKVIIAILALIAMQSVMTQAPVPWICCKKENRVEPQLGGKCDSGRRAQQVKTDQYCPLKDVKPTRRMQQIVTEPKCTNLNSRRRLQAIEIKCPVNIQGVQCFVNNSNANCKPVY